MYLKTMALTKTLLIHPTCNYVQISPAIWYKKIAILGDYLYAEHKITVRA